MGRCRCWPVLLMLLLAPPTRAFLPLFSSQSGASDIRKPSTDMRNETRQLCEEGGGQHPNYSHIDVVRCDLRSPVGPSTSPPNPPRPHPSSAANCSDGLVRVVGAEGQSTTRTRHRRRVARHAQSPRWSLTDRATAGGAPNRAGGSDGLTGMRHPTSDQAASVQLPLQAPLLRASPPKPVYTVLWQRGEQLNGVLEAVDPFNTHG
jgi:hypothetical protein